MGANTGTIILKVWGQACTYRRVDQTIVSGVSRANILTNFSDSSENIDQVSSLVANGIAYTEYLG